MITIGNYSFTILSSLQNCVSQYYENYNGPRIFGVPVIPHDGALLWEGFKESPTYQIPKLLYKSTKKLIKKLKGGGKFFLLLQLLQLDMNLFRFQRDTGPAEPEPEPEQ